MGQGALPHPLTGQAFPSPVPPGTGWPEDPACHDTLVAGTADDVGVLSATDDLDELGARVSVCRACPRLVAWREDVALKKRASFADQPYWGRPIAGWGAANPSVLIVGLAPAANGGNRTGRIFTGDSSGDWLFASLHRTGLARQPTSLHAGDGQALIDARMVAAVRCAPPDNKPTPEEITRCLDHLDVELALLPNVRVVVALGKIGFDAWLQLMKRRGARACPRPQFGHGVVADLDSKLPLLMGCYHPSRQNTNTGKLTAPMMEAVFGKARRLLEARPRTAR